jgi:hypothetical protein
MPNKPTNKPAHSKEQHISVEVDLGTSDVKILAEVRKALKMRPVHTVRGKKPKKLLMLVREEGPFGGDDGN